MVNDDGRKVSANLRHLAVKISEKYMTLNKDIQADIVLTDGRQRHECIAVFIKEILAAEQRILVKQSEKNANKNAINLYKESILIRELFACIARYLNLALHLSNEQYPIVKRVWYKSLNTALVASQNIKNKATILRIESNMVNAFVNIKAP